MGITAIATLLFLASLLMWVRALSAIRAHAVPTGGDFFRLSILSVIFPLVFGVFLALVGVGLLRLRNWARFAAMLIIFVGAGAELPLLVRAATHFDWRVFLGAVEFLARLLAVWYLFRSASVDHFLKRTSTA